MHLLTTTPIAAIAALLLIWLGPVRGFWIVVVTLPFGVMAAVNLPALGGTSLLVADIAALCLILLVISGRGNLPAIFAFLRFGQPGGLLLPLIAVATLGAIFGPRLFQGEIDVFSLTRAHGSGAIAPVPLGPSTGNLAQLVRFALGLATFASVAIALKTPDSARAVLRALWVATVVHIGVSVVSLAGPWMGSLDVMTWMRTANYEVLDHQAIGGIKRLVGGFPEATAHGRMTLGLCAFWTIYALRTGRGWGLALLLLLLLIRSLSTATWIAMISVALCICLTHFATALKSRSPVGAGISVVGVPLICALGLAAILWIPQVSVLWDDLIASKLGSHSGQQRLDWNARALAAFWDSGGLGVGVGSLRGSGWIGVILGSMGIVGAALFCAFLVGQFSALRQNGSAVSAALFWGAGAMLVQSSIVATTPDLGLSFYIFLGAAVALVPMRQTVSVPCNPHDAQVAW